MHKFVMRKKFKGAIDAVIATKRMGSSKRGLGALFGGASEAASTEAAKTEPDAVIESMVARVSDHAPAATA